MRKLIAAINMTLDGFCDHTEMIADDEIHDHYNDLLRTAGGLLYGRITYQLMEDYWPTIVANPTGNKPIDDFAILIDDIPKIVYSTGDDLFVGSPGLIVALSNLDVIDEYQIAVQPIILGSGLRLFKNITDRKDLTLLKTKIFGCGAIVLYFEAANKS